MKKWIIPVLVVAFILVSCNLPFSITINPNTPAAPTAENTTEVIVVTATPQPAEPTIAPTATVQFIGVEKNLGGVYMVIPACLASDASGVIVPADNIPEGSPVYGLPELRLITLIGYPLEGKEMKPEVKVIPVAAFEALIPSVSANVVTLQQYFASHPVDYPSGIPAPAIQGAAQVFRAQASYLNFQNGQGIGFLTEYAQYFAPVNNTDLFYTYQGLTNDGKYWVSMTLPVNAAYLQASYNQPAVPADGIAAPDPSASNLDVLFKTYYTAMVEKLNTTPSDQFTPSLSCIAQFVQSLSIND